MQPSKLGSTRCIARFCRAELAPLGANPHRQPSKLGSTMMGRCSRASSALRDASRFCRAELAPLGANPHRQPSKLGSTMMGRCSRASSALRGASRFCRAELAPHSRNIHHRSRASSALQHCPVLSCHSIRPACSYPFGKRRMIDMLAQRRALANRLECLRKSSITTNQRIHSRRDERGDTFGILIAACSG